jgi:hypothetical protein
MRRKGISLQERFEARVVRTEAACWKWVGSVNQSGRGQLKINGAFLTASHVSYNLYNGSVPTGLYVLHKCDNPNCVNPEHLFLGSQSDNMQDMVSKGRQSVLKGELSPTCKLSDAQVIEIRRRHKPWCPKNGTAPMAREFGVTYGHIQKIVHLKIRAS